MPGAIFDVASVDVRVAESSTRAGIPNRDIPVGLGIRPEKPNGKCVGSDLCVFRDRPMSLVPIADHAAPSSLPREGFEP